MIKDRIKELREKNGLTISAFAKSLGISPTSASLYESGKQNPGKKTIAKICEVYGVEESYLSSSAPTDKATPTDKEDDGAVEDTPADKAVEEKKRGRRPKKTDVVNEEKEPDIPAILARVAEVGVRKASAEAGVAWQTVNKWKKDAEKAALSSSEEIQKEADNLTTPESAQEAVNAPDEGKKEPDISAILARVAEIGVRKAAAEAGVAWQTVNKWKKDAAATQTAPITSTAHNKEEKKAEQKDEKKNDVVDAEEKKTAIIIQSPMGGSITPAQILKKIPSGSDSVYVRVDENKLYWVKGDENGAVDIWG